MPSARDIADERFAKGEITADEYDALVARLTASSPKLPPPLPEPPPHRAEPPPLPLPPNMAPRQEAVASKPFPWVPVLLGGGGALIALVSLGAYLNDNQMSIGNISVSGESVSFRLANPSSFLSGDVVIWLEQGEIDFCEYVTSIEASSVNNITVNCPNIQNGRFLVRVDWSENEAGKARIATRF